MNNALTTFVLSNTDGRHTTFCSFRPLCDGLVLVAGYATHTDYVSAGVIDCAEAKALWQEKRRAGFKRNADSEALYAHAEEAPARVSRLRAGAHARLAA